MSGPPAVAELEAQDAPRFVFPRGNAVVFHMDFATWRGVPSDRVFYKTTDEPGHDRANLVAVGYGLKGDYGSGSIFVNNADLPEPLP